MVNYDESNKNEADAIFPFLPVNRLRKLEVCRGAVTR